MIETTMNTVKKLFAVKYGETDINEAMAYRGGDKSVKVPISLIVYLIETERRKILIDAGCDSMPGYELRNFSSPTETLRRAGISPEEITDVVLTHAHHDHAEAAHHFKNAVIHIEKDEYKAAKCFLPDGLFVNVFENEIELDGVRAMKISGHSWGSCAVEFSYHGKPYVICGDECYVRRCLAEKICTGASVCPEKSLAFLYKYGSGDYVTLLCHDGEILKGQNGVLAL